MFCSALQTWFAVCLNPCMNADQIINALGGTVAVALLCDTSPAAVSQWRKAGIPKARLMYLQVVRPEVFAGPQSPAKSEAVANE